MERLEMKIEMKKGRNGKKKVAKAQARAKILDLLDMLPLEGEEDSKGRNIIVHNKQMIDTNIALGKQYENWKEFIPGKKYIIIVIPYFKMESPSYASDYNSRFGEVSKMLCQLVSLAKGGTRS